MIILTQSSDSIKISLDGNVTTNQLMCYASYRKSDDNTFTPARQATLTNNTTFVTLVSGQDNYSTGIDFINVYNSDTVAASATIVANISSADYTLWRGVLQAGERVEYNNKGFYVKSSTGVEKTIYNYNYTLSSTDNFSLSSLDADVSNSTTTLADVPGIGFTATADKLYWFRFILRYASGGTAVGSFFSITGPASPTYLVFSTEESNAATTVASSPLNVTYDAGILAGNSSSTPNCRAVIEGMIVASTTGDVIPRFRSEVAGTAITVNPGSFVEWEEIYSYV